MTQPSTPQSKAPGFIFGDKIYNRGKWITMIFLPAFSTLYFTLSEIWGLPEAMKVMGTTSAISAFIGILLGLSAKTYNNSAARYDGTLDITHVDGTKVVGLNLHTDPDNLELFPEVKFKVTRGQSSNQNESQH